MPEKIIANVDAECFLVGYVLIHPGDYLAVDIEAADFYDNRHKRIWETFQRITRRGQGIDYLAVVDDLENCRQLGNIGGQAYLTGLLAGVPIGFNPETSARIIRDHARRRDMLTLASEMARAAHDEKNELDPGVFIGKMTSVSGVKNGAVHWSQFMGELYDDIQERTLDPKEVWGIPTGFADFDKITGGLHPGESMMMSGKPGVGKSILAVQMAEQMSLTSPGAIYSVEMKGRQVMRRTISAFSKVPTSRMKSGKLEDNDWTAITQAIATLSERPVYMSDASDWTTTGLRADLTRLKMQHKIEWFVFDYLMLANDAPGRDEIERTAIISRNMKLICRHLDLAGIVVHSMNKAGIEATTPDQNNLRGSGQVSYDADLIVFLTEFNPLGPDDAWIPEKERINMRTLHFGKGRELENPQRYFHLVKRPFYPAFGDYDGRH